jgi:hypothetical protein
MSRWPLAILISTSVISSDAWSQHSFRELEHNTQFEQALRAVEAIKRRKRVQCVMSIANGPVCTCLAEKLPVDTHVRSYAAITSPDNDRRDYGPLSAADREIVDHCLSP